MASFTAREISAHESAHGSRMGKALLQRGILQKVIFPVTSNEFSSVCVLNDVVWQNLSSHQLSP